MNRFIHAMMGHYLQNAAGADGADGGDGSILGGATSAPPTAEPPAAGATPPATEPPAAGATPPAGEPGKTEPPAGAPEKYEFKLPEGLQLNEEVSGSFEKFARELNLPQDKAQAVVDMGAQLVQQVAAQQAEAYQQQQQQWVSEIRQDKEIGGDALPQNLAYAAKVLDTFAPDLRQVLDETGMGNNPALIRAFVKIGKAISEDRLIGGAQTGNPGAAVDPAKIMFPGMN